MLVLSRKPQESITCELPDGRQITITLTRAWRDGARIGIAAPADVRIVRTELLDIDRVTERCPDLGNY